MSSVLESDEDVIKDGKVISESISQGVGSFTPDIMFEKMVKNFKEAKKLYGETIIRELSGYDPGYIDKNRKIPEFQRQLKSNLDQKIHDLQDKGLLDKDLVVSDRGLFLGSLVMYVEELDNLLPKGLGEKESKERYLYGEKAEVLPYRKGRFRDIALKKSVKLAVRRGHKVLQSEDLRIHERIRKGKISIIYAIDGSGSMRGDKLKVSKKAGIALAFKALEEKNSVGLIVFEKEVRAALPPCTDFMLLLKELAKVRAGSETNFAKVATKSMELFTKKNQTRHLVFITDALPTVGKNPIEETLKSVSAARADGITVSIIGIQLEDEGLELAQKIADVGGGRFIVCKNLEDLDKLVLQDYALTVAE